ncbi:helix-turn-helix transcriptional regulator [Microcystis aeruginosa]|uniref:Transcriptional activator protein EsaR n=2 Tax=Microcystis TaxID=1125 RepID=A0A5A5S9F9_MICAE|nr:helix-turn-helix transcriptional regulator [Microcystis aeruginosa]GCA82012.1 transcriptional activator protein EsaR [Microcystis aeruginosa NIES-2521]
MDEQNGLESSQINQLLTLFRGVLNSRGLIILSKDGNVEFITQQAEQLLVSFFPTTISQANLLPHHLTKWFQFQISQPLESDDSCIYQTLKIEQGKQVLKIHLIPIPKSMGDNYYLLLEKKEKTMFSVPDLELLGLTHCEAKILFWVSRDKTNIEITKLAGISEGTVRKHLEHIYKKLGVHSRVGAVIIALEKLGILVE